MATGETVTLPARSDPGGGRNAAEYRAGARGREQRGPRREYFQAVDEDGQPVKPERVAKPADARADVAAARRPAISFFGDLHPSFSGNVVKAMGSAKQGYPVVSRML